MTSMIQPSQFYRVLVKAIDAAGLESEPAASDPILIDTTPPAGITCDKYHAVDSKNMELTHSPSVHQDTYLAKFFVEESARDELVKIVINAVRLQPQAGGLEFCLHGVDDPTITEIQYRFLHESRPLGHHATAVWANGELELTWSNVFRVKHDVTYSVYAGTAEGYDKRFKHDVDTTEEESGEKFQLHSEGMLAEIIDLDSMPEVKRVACAGDRLMLLMNDTTPAHDWKIDQVVLGGPQWGCNVTRHDPKPKDIYVKIVSMFFPLDGQVTIHHAQAGPFDMLEEANIHFHYEPGKKAHRLHSFAKEEKRHRYRRALSNLVSDILNNIDWHANFTADIPFDVGLSDNATDESGNATESERFDVESNIEADAAMHFKREIGLMYNTTLFNTPSTEVFRIPVIKAKPDIPAVFLSVSYDAQTFADVQAYSAGKSSLRTSFNGSGVKPDVKLRSSSPGLSRCVESSISVNSHVHAARAHFTADAFGLKIWDVALQPAMTKDIYLINSSLGQGCDARCHGASVLNSDLFNSTHSTAAPTGLTTFSGNQAQVMDCAAHTPATPCASRQMMSRMAAALSELADFVTVEWPEKQLLILEALDNKGVHEAGSLYKLGRAVTVGLIAHSDSPVSSPTPLDLDFLALTRLGQLAVCAGMDAVQQVANESKLQLAVREDGWSLEDRDLEERRTMFWEGMDNMVYPVGVDDSEYTYPDDLTEESVLPVLVDGGFPPETQISEHVRLRDVMSSDKRYFRLDASLLECIELAQEDFTGTIEILPDSVYRSRSTNFLRNFDLRHVQEKWRFQAGQAMLLRPQGKVTPETLLALATSVLRECPALVRLQMRAVGLGCHSDHIYVDLRPLIPGHERVYVMVWDADRTSYCNDVMRLQKNMVEGPVFDNKVRACARLVHKYIERAASPFPDLSNVTTFFNTDTELSTVQALACKDGYVCVEDTPVYSLLVPTVTARYYPNPKKSLERALFSADINPTPLLELVAQEMAFRAKGVVKVFIEAEKDTRFAMTPFTVVTMEKERHRRSAEDSIPRNKVKSRIYNWEREWLDKMF
nr:hypothetical protein BaRGS_031101 [Batillaria attramentaria]